jgi:enamine deaminase RidA (YjgF/YER057c/UK114 family)
MKHVQPDGWPRPSGYSDGMIGEGRLFALAGQIGWNPRTHAFDAKDFAGQARQALFNVVALLRAAGVGPRDVIRLTWYITDRDAYLSSIRSLGTAYREAFDDHFPAMSVVIVAGLLEPEALVEIEATALVRGKKEIG